DDGEHLEGEGLGGPAATRYARTSECEALPAGRDDGRLVILDTDADDGPQVRDLGIPTASDAAAHHPSTIVVANVVSHHLRHGIPVPSREVRVEAVKYSAGRVFQPRR